MSLPNAQLGEDGIVEERRRRIVVEVEGAVARQDVVAVAADQRVIALGAGEDVGIGVAGQAIGAERAAEIFHVGEGPVADAGRLRRALQRERDGDAGGGVERLEGRVGDVDRVAAGAAVGDLVALADGEIVVAAIADSMSVPLKVQNQFAASLPISVSLP